MKPPATPFAWVTALARAGARALGQFSTTPPADRLGVGRALVVVAAARLAVRTLACHDAVTLIDALARRLPRGPLGEPPRSARDVPAAVDRACRTLPGTSTCLADAFAGRALLRLEGLPAEVRIGVRREPGGGLRAHAWVEIHGNVVLGAGPEEFEPFPGPVW